VAQERIILIGMHETLEELDKFDKHAVLLFNAAIESTLGEAAASASRFIPEKPMSGWQLSRSSNLSESPTGGMAAMRKSVKSARAKGQSGLKARSGAGWPIWSQGAAIAGIKTSRKVGKVRGDYTTSAGALIQNDPSGAIFEVAGRKGATGQFITNLDRFKKASRGIWRALDEKEGSYEAKIAAALNQAKTALQRHLDTNRGR